MKRRGKKNTINISPPPPPPVESSGGGEWWREGNEKEKKRFSYKGGQNANHIGNFDQCSRTKNFLVGQVFTNGEIA